MLNLTSSRLNFRRRDLNLPRRKNLDATLVSKATIYYHDYTCNICSPLLTQHFHSQTFLSISSNSIKTIQTLASARSHTNLITSVTTSSTSPSAPSSVLSGLDSDSKLLNHSSVSTQLFWQPWVLLSSTMVRSP